jgi:hypothetical protein
MCSKISQVTEEMRGKRVKEEKVENQIESHLLLHNHDYNTTPI